MARDFASVSKFSTSKRDQLKGVRQAVDVRGEVDLSTLNIFYYLKEDQKYLPCNEIWCPLPYLDTDDSCQITGNHLMETCTYPRRHVACCTLGSLPRACTAGHHFHNDPISGALQHSWGPHWRQEMAPTVGCYSPGWQFNKPLSLALAHGGRGRVRLRRR